MATITDYTSLLSNVSDYLGDTLKVNSYPTFIQLFEAQAARYLSVRQQQVSVSLPLVAGSATLPTDYVQWRSVLWTGTTPYVKLKWIDPAYFDTISPVLTSGSPQYFLIRGSTISIRRSVSTSPILFDYFSTITPLTLAAPTNWLLTLCPDAYLYGVLLEAASFGEFTEAAVIWKARRDDALKQIQDEYNEQLGETADSVREDSYF